MKAFSILAFLFISFASFGQSKHQLGFSLITNGNYLSSSTIPSSASISGKALIGFRNFSPALLIYARRHTYYHEISLNVISFKGEESNSTKKITNGNVRYALFANIPINIIRGLSFSPGASAEIYLAHVVRIPDVSTAFPTEFNSGGIIFGGIPRLDYRPIKSLQFSFDLINPLFGISYNHSYFNNPTISEEQRVNEYVTVNKRGEFIARFSITLLINR